MSASAKRRAEIAARVQREWRDPEYREEAMAAIRKKQPLNSSSRMITWSLEKEITSKIRMKWRDTASKIKKAETRFEQQAEKTSGVESRLERRMKKKSKKRRIKKNAGEEEEPRFRRTGSSFSKNTPDWVLERQEEMMRKRGFF